MTEEEGEREERHKTMRGEHGGCYINLSALVFLSERAGNDPLGSFRTVWRLLMWLLASEGTAHY